MKFHGITLQEGSKVHNLTVASDTAFPTSPDEGELFFRSDALSTVKGLYIYIGGNWDRISSTDSSTVQTGVTLPNTANPGDLFYKNSNDGSEGLYVFNDSTWIGVTGSAGVGLPVGGLTDQVLVKSTNADYDVKWEARAKTGENNDITSMTGITGGISAVDFIDFNTGPEAPSKLRWNDGDGTLEFDLKGGNSVLQIGQEQVQRIWNNTGTTLNDGDVVCITGAQGQRLTVSKASSDTEGTSSNTFGVVTETILNETEGFVTTFGLVRNINTSAYAEGAALWLGTAGSLTATKPVAPNHAVLIGFCVRSHESAGSIFVKVQNGYELDELHDVHITMPQANDSLVRDAVYGYWKNISSAALVALGLPAQSGNDSKFLKTDGISLSWSSLIASGNNTQIQFNNNGFFGASSKFRWNDDNSNLLFEPSASTVKISVADSLVPGSFDIVAGASIGTAGESGGNLNLTAGFSGSGTAGDVNISGGISGVNATYAGEVSISTANTQRVKFLKTGAWSVGVNDTFTGLANQALISTGASSPPEWGSVVRSVSINSTNGLSGSILTSNGNAQVTLKTTVTGLLKGNQLTGVISAATAGTDYLNSVTLTGDVTGTGGSTINTTLSSVGTAGTYGNANSVPVLTIDTKGRVTAVSPTSIEIAESQITDGSILARVGSSETISGAWTFTQPVSGVEPVNGSDLATKTYVDNIALGLDVKASVRAATTANITLSGTQTVDDVILQIGDRVLVKNQTTASQNGIYVVASGAWARAADADNTPSGEVTSGMFTFVEEGTANNNSGWILTTDGIITLGSTELTFVQFSGGAMVNAGTGISIDGSTINNTGVLSLVAGNGITISGATGNVTVSAIDETPVGALGQLQFVTVNNSNTVEQDYLVYEGAFVSSESELTAAKNNIVDNSTVFNTWTRYSHWATDDTQPAIPAELTTWSYDGNTDTLNNTTNSTSAIGVISTDKFSSYVLETKIYSTNADDDNIGVVIAWFVDSNGKEHTLSAIRSPGGFSFTWAVFYDFGRTSTWTVANGTQYIKWGNGNYGANLAASGYTTNPTIGGWDDFGTTGCRIKVTRNGDIITLETTDLGESTYVSAATLTIDLTSDSRLQQFRGPKSYGYVSFSQSHSNWVVLQFSGSANTIYDLENNEVWSYNAGTSSWAINTSQSYDTNIGYGRLLHNPSSKKLFYVKESGEYSLIASSLTHDDISANLAAGIDRLAITSTNEVTLSSTNDPLRIGLLSSTNIAIDSDEIQARNNAAAGDLFLNPHGGRITIGSATSAAPLRIVSSTSDTTILADAYGTSNAQFVTRKARGTEAVPTAVLTNDILGSFASRGFNGTEFNIISPAALVIRAGENWTGTANGTKISFFNTPNLSTDRKLRFELGSSNSIFYNNSESPVLSINDDFTVTAYGVLHIAPTSGNTGIEIGARGSASTSVIDFHSGATDTNYDVRLASSGGNGTDGNGDLTITAASTTFSKKIIVNDTFNIDGDAPSTQQDGLYVADLGGTTGTTNNPIYTAAICGQYGTNRSVAFSVDGGGYLWGFRTHTNAGSYTWQSKTKSADSITTAPDVNQLTGSVTTTSTSVVNLDVLPITTYRSAKYEIQIVKGSDVQVCEIRTFHDGTNGYHIEYGKSVSNTGLGTFTSDVFGGNLRLKFAPTSASSTVVKFYRTALTV